MSVRVIPLFHLLINMLKRCPVFWADLRIVFSLLLWYYLIVKRFMKRVEGIA